MSSSDGVSSTSQQVLVNMEIDCVTTSMLHLNSCENLQQVLHEKDMVICSEETLDIPTDDKQKDMVICSEETLDISTDDKQKDMVICSEETLDIPTDDKQKDMVICSEETLDIPTDDKQKDMVICSEETLDIPTDDKQKDMVICSEETLDIPTDDTTLLNFIKLKDYSQALRLLIGNRSFSQDALDQALILACQCGHSYIMYMLVHLGASVHYQDINGNTALLICAEKGFTDIVCFLLAKKADINHVNSAGNTTLILSTCSSVPSSKMTNVILAHRGININHQNQDGCTALMKAAELMDFNMIQILLNAYFIRNTASADGYNSLQCVFIDKTINCKGQTAPEIAEKAGIGNVFKLIRQAVSLRVSPLVLAVETCQVDSLTILLNSQFTDTWKSICEAFSLIFHRCQIREVQQFDEQDIQMIKQLLEYGVDIDIHLYDIRYQNPLSIAIEAGCHTGVELLCKHRRLENELHPRPPTVGSLVLFVDRQNHRFDKQILENHYRKGFHPQNKQCSDPYIESAIIQGRVECAKILLSYATEIDITYALISAVIHQVEDLVKFMFSRYPCFIHRHIVKIGCDRFILEVAVREGNLEIIGLILHHVTSVNQLIGKGVTALVAAKNGKVAQYLIKSGANVNQEISNRYLKGAVLIHVMFTRPIQESATMEVIQVLLENGAHVNGHLPRNALNMAASVKKGAVRLLKMLLDYGADFNGRDRPGNTALMTAILQNCNENAIFLIEYAAAAGKLDVLNLKNYRGLTALVCAVARSNLSLIKDLISHGVDVNTTDMYDNTVLMPAVNTYCECDEHVKNTYSLSDVILPTSEVKKLKAQESCNHKEILHFLIKAGCNVNTQNIEGVSPLMLAANRCNHDIISFLLDSGADINAISKNDCTETALSFLLNITFSEEEKLRCLETLLEHGAICSGLSPVVFFRVIQQRQTQIIAKLIQYGVGPAAVKKEVLKLKGIEGGLLSHVSPLCMALLAGNISLACFFVDNLFLTNCDVSSLLYNQGVKHLLKAYKPNVGQAFLDGTPSHPISLFALSFVAVSSAVGAFTGRENRISLLPLPQTMKDRLLFRSSPVKNKISTFLFGSYKSIHDIKS